MNIKDRQKLQALSRTQLERLITSIFDEMDGRYWNADTTQEIERAFDRAGFQLRGPEEEGDE